MRSVYYGLLLFVGFFTRSAFTQDERTLLGNWKDGYGIYLYSNNAIYDGYWKDGKRNGLGRFYFQDGQGFEGQYVDDIKFGPGTYRWASGSRYTGYWNDQNRHGWGESVAADGTKKSGFWKDDKFLSDSRPVYKITPDGKGSFKTVQEAIDAAIPGTEIVIANGNYEEYLSITNKMNLIIRGEGDVWFKVPTGDIFTIGNSRDITITNIKGIHTVRETEPDACSTSDVMEVYASREIRIVQCVLDGCGQIGLTASHVQSLLLANTIVQNCIFGGIDLYQCQDVWIENNLVVNQKMDAKEAPRGVALNMINCSNFEVRNNTIANNDNFLPFSIGGEFTKGIIHHNIIAFNNQLEEEAKIIEASNMEPNTVHFDKNLVFDNRVGSKLLTVNDPLVKITNTIVQDPLFENMEQRNYSLKKQSPALLTNIGATLTPIPQNYSLSLQDPRFTESSLKKGSIYLSGRDTTVYVSWPYSDADGWAFINGRRMNYINGSWQGKILKNEIGAAVLTAVLRDGRVGQSLTAVELKEPPVKAPLGDNANDFVRKAIVLNDSTLFKQALPYLVYAARINWTNADAYAVRAWSLANLNDAPKARAYADLAVRINYSAGSLFIKGYCELLLGNSDSARTVFAEGLKILTRAAQFDELKTNLKSEFIDKNQRVSEAKSILSWVDEYYSKNGKAFTAALEPVISPQNDSAYNELIDRLREKLTAFPSLPPAFWNSLWFDMASYFTSSGDYTRGLNCLSIAEERLPGDDLANAMARVRSARTYSDIYDALGQFDKQSWHLMNALKLSEKLPTAYPRIGLLNSLASAEAFQNKSTAFDYIKQARELAEKSGNAYHIADAYVRNCMIIMNDSRANDAEAAKYAEKALSIARENKLSYSMNGAISNLAISHFRKGDYAKGIKLYDEAIDSARSQGRLRDAELFLNNAGSMYYMMKDYAKAAGYFSGSIRIVEELRQGMSPEERRLFFANTVSSYQFLSMCYARLRKGQELFESLEASKARTLAEKLTGDDSTKIVSLREAQALLGPDEAMISYMLSYSYLEIIISVVTRDNAVAIHTTRTNLFDGIKSKYGTEMKLVAENKRGMKPKQAIAQDQPPEVYSPTGFIFDEMIELYRRALQSGQNETMQNDLGRLFYSALIEPALPYLNGKARLLIIPENTLGYLPFETLKDGSGKYLVENYFVKYTQSMSVYAIVNNRSYSAMRSPILAVGNPQYESPNQGYSENYDPSNMDDFMKLENEINKRLSANEPLQAAYAKIGVTSWNPLPGTAYEISEIKKMVPEAQLLSQSDADEKKIKTLSSSGSLQNYRIIHFASHGVVIPAFPALSAVVLSQASRPTQSEDGYLTMKEISKLKLRSDLVNLSACETGLGKLYGGEGVVGLTQAFQQAGANALCVSLWSVADESTAKYMIGFYDLSLLQNRSFMDAATEMKRKFIKGEFGEQYKKPFYWGPFVYYGK